jgi:PAS domain S-box-containing protein
MSKEFASGAVSRVSRDGPATIRPTALQEGGVVADLTALMDHAPLGFALLDRVLCFSRVNRFLADLFGMPADLYMGQSIFDLSPELAECLEPMAERVLENGEVILEQELSLRHRKTGRLMRGSASFYPVRSADGAIIGVGLTLIDVTQRHDEERFRDIFVGVLGHDLRTPIQSMILSCGVIMRQEALPDNVRNRVNTLCDSAKRMGRMIEQILDLTRIRSGNMPVSFHQVDLVTIVKELVEQQLLLTPEASIRLSAPRALVGLWDADRLNQLVTNLLGNALRHGAAGSDIELELGDIDGMARLTIKNSGRAIPASVLSTLFTPFHRQAGVRRKSLGLGLGLYIAREIVMAHGGEITVDSSDERTCFSVILPKIAARLQ